jgi:DNA repair exonuclease SbcCD ATPase subunit
MVRSFAFLPALAACVLAASSASAQQPVAPTQIHPPAPSTEGGRFSYNIVNDGLVRLDRRTGTVSHCRRRGAAWSCEPAVDDRAAPDAATIKQLSEKVARLEAELARRGAAEAEVVRLASRVASLEQELARRARAAGEDPLLAKRIADLEAELARRATAEADVSGLSRQVASFEAELARRAAAEAEVARLASRVASLEQELARRASAETDGARLSERIARLEAELARRAAEPPAPTPPLPIPPQAAPVPEPAPKQSVRPPAQFPTEDEIERAMRYLENLFRRFMTMVDKLRREVEPGST